MWLEEADGALATARPPKVTEDRLVIPEALWGNWEDYVGPICPDPCPGTVIELRHVPFKVACVRHPVTR